MNLQVAVNADFRKYLDYPSVPYERDDLVFYDSVSNQTISLFDSIVNGVTSISIFSLLTNDFKKTIDLQSDTLIYFDTTLYSSFKIGNPKALLNFTNNIADTFYIGQKVVGCFGGYTEKIVINKIDENYQINYNRNNDSTLNTKALIPDTSFNKNFKIFLIDCKKLFPITKRGVFHFQSTTTIDTYIRNGNTIYRLPDLGDWKGYDNFKKIVGIKVEE